MQSFEVSDNSRYRSYLAKAQLQQETICHKLNILLHQVSIHADQFYRQCIRQEFLENIKGL